MSQLTWCVNSYRNLPYLKLAIESIRKNAFYKNSPIVVYTENDSETGDWIKSQPDITPIIEFNPIPKGIGGGANVAIANVKTEYFSLLHSDMYISRHYDRVLLDIAKANEKTVACAWRLEPDIWKQPSRMGTTMIPTNPDDGFGVYWHDFQAENFEAFAEDFVAANNIQFRKVEGVSYVMRKSDWDKIGGNDPRYAPSSFEDHSLSVRMQCENYNFVVTSKALVWHFGSRGANFMDQPDKITGRSQRQIECENRNIKTWIEEWGCFPQYDEYGFVIATDDMKKIYEKNKEKYRFI